MIAKLEFQKPIDIISSEESYEVLIKFDTFQNGYDGDSAYAVACKNGFSGTEEEWLESLIGGIGPVGPKGDKGNKGDNGYSAYDIAVINGYLGSEEDWLESLKGEGISDIFKTYVGTTSLIESSEIDLELFEYDTLDQRLQVEPEYVYGLNITYTVLVTNYHYYKGNVDNETTYEYKDVVDNDGNYYVCINEAGTLGFITSEDWQAVDLHKDYGYGEIGYVLMLNDEGHVDYDSSETLMLDTIPTFDGLTIEELEDQTDGYVKIKINANPDSIYFGHDVSAKAIVKINKTKI